MTKQSNKIRELLYVIIFTIVLFLLIDCFAGSWLLSIAKRELPKDKFRTPHEIYHHTLKPNYNGIGYWGPGTYHVCTNGSAFKDRCENVGVKEKSFDIAFIGDSFTEGVGMPYEETFVGMVANQYPELKIANLGVVSYSPSIYLAKLKEFYKQGYSFKNVIVFIDIGDVQDEALTYEVVNGRVLSRHEQMPDGFIPKLRRYASRLLPLTGFIWNKIKSFPASQLSPRDDESIHKLKDVITSTPLTTPLAEHTLKNDNSYNPKKAEVSTPSFTPVATTSTPVMPNAPIEEASIYEKNFTRSAWTYNTNSPGYGPDGVMGTIAKMTATMQELYQLTQANGSTLSIGVYPWPGQIKFDTEDSLQVRVWQNFCLTRCKNFYNAFPIFFKIKSLLGEDDLIHKLYLGGDMHFNREGNRIIFETIQVKGIK